MNLNRDRLAAQAFLDAFGRGDTRAMEDLLAPDFVLRQADSLPYAGTYRGVEGWRQMLARFTETWSRLVPSGVTLVGEGPHVAVLADVEFTSKATGRELRTTVCEFWTLRDGRIVEIRPFYWDTAAIAALVA